MGGAQCLLGNGVLKQLYINRSIDPSVATASTTVSTTAASVTTNATATVSSAVNISHT